MSVRATLVEIFSRVVKVEDKDKDKLYINGANNLYPNEVEGVINNSPTAFRCANLMARYIEGKGIVHPDGRLIPYGEQPILNPAKGYRTTDILALAAKNLSYQNGVYFHVIYGINDEGNPFQKGIDVLNYTKCRKSKEDDEDYPGMILYKNWEKKESFRAKKEETYKFYPYNPNTEIVIAQIKADAGVKDEDEFDIYEAIKHYRGQVYYLNLNPDQVYASSLLDSVYNDADTEYRIGLYNNSQARIGFLGKTIFLTQGLDEETSEEIKEDLAEFMGAAESANLYHLDVEQSDDLDKVLKIHQLKPQFDDKLFSETKTTSRKNILGAFNNVPEILILAGDGALFGTSSDTYQEAKLFYSEQTEREREQLERAFFYMGFPVKIEPIAKRTENDL